MPCVAGVTVSRRWRLEIQDEAELEADGTRLGLALDALVENAVEHTAEPDMIELGARRVGNRVAITVRDTGPGIPPEQQERIFERFARGSPGRRGAGLGLAIVKAIVEAHRGQVRIASGPGRGSTFEILLPLAPRRDGPPPPAGEPQPSRRGSR